MKGLLLSEWCDVFPFTKLVHWKTRLSLQTVLEADGKLDKRSTSGMAKACGRLLAGA